MTKRKITIIIIVAALVAAAIPVAVHITSSLRQVEVTFDANGGIIAGAGDGGTSAAGTTGANEADGASGDTSTAGGGSTEAAAKTTLEAKPGDPLPDVTATRNLYSFEGWFDSAEGGSKVTKVPEGGGTLFAHWKSSNKDRAVTITGVRSNRRDNVVRISAAESENKVIARFVLSGYFGQDVAFVNKAGEVIKKIAVKAEPGQKNVIVRVYLPNRIWMNRKRSVYYIKSFANDHVDESKIAKLGLTLGGQYEYFDQPIEGSTVWYGGTAAAPADRRAVIAATDSAYVYAKRDGKLYTWEKSSCMINLADVRTDPVYDIYNAYSSRFFPIEGKCMYSDNGGYGLARYDSVSKESAMKKNRKTGATTFQVPVQWDFAQTVALAQERARAAGYTIYIVDSFRPMNSVDPVANAVNDRGMLAAGGTSAHNFGFAVDCGWQQVDASGRPVGEPYVKNLQALNRTLAVQGPNGNARQSWWAGVNKLNQEWWHYGDTLLRSGYSAHAQRVGSLYVNQQQCISMKRSALK